ncbi:MAG TPA: hypothetical protein VK789_12490 [Bryobacteraceae bacterium]|nr:hypothetical protein [Bryobacteraceae bacterium]
MAGFEPITVVWFSGDHQGHRGICRAPWMSFAQNLSVWADEAVLKRLKAFNVFNHAQWALFNSSIVFNNGVVTNLPGAPGGGRVGFGALSATRPNSYRILQIAAKFYF